MKKNNFWNRIFHPTEVKENQLNAELCRHHIQHAPDLIKQIINAESLEELLGINQIAFDTPSNLDLPTKDTVYLGGIYGLNTQPISYWEQHKDAKYGVNSFGISETYPLYQLVLDQYSDILANSIKSLYRDSVDKINKYHIYGY